MTEAERSAASYLTRAGHEVVRISGATKDGLRSADFRVDGKLTELKTLSNISSPNFTGAVIGRIREGAKQAPNVLIDARGQPGMTESAANEIMSAVKRTARDAQIHSLRIFGRDFDVRMVR